MKRTSYVLIIFIALTPAAPGFSQSPATVIEALDIELWPDYDKPSVLVLLTGTLPGDTPLPATVSLPLPKTARLNAVARIDSKDGIMKDDIVSSTYSPGTLTLVTPDSRFRVEYYLPYALNKNQRSFDYTWSSATSVNKLQLRVQRPSSASTLNTEPAAANIARSGDGFDYHTFPAGPVEAGQTFSLHVEYIMNRARLSAVNFPPPDNNSQIPAASGRADTSDGMDWALIAVIAGSLLIFGALVWQVASRRAGDNSGKSADSGIKKRPQPRFCRDCGEPTHDDDRFCGGCGSKL